MRELASDSEAEYIRSLIGGEAEVLFETERDGECEGLTSSYVTVRVNGCGAKLKNNIRNVRLEKAGNGFIKGTLI